MSRTKKLEGTDCLTQTAMTKYWSDMMISFLNYIMDSMFGTPPDSVRVVITASIPGLSGTKGIKSKSLSKEGLLAYRGGPVIYSVTDGNHLEVYIDAPEKKREDLMKEINERWFQRILKQNESK